MRLSLYWLGGAQGAFLSFHPKALHQELLCALFEKAMRGRDWSPDSTPHQSGDNAHLLTKGCDKRKTGLERTGVIPIGFEPATLSPVTTGDADQGRSEL